MHCPLTSSAENHEYHCEVPDLLSLLQHITAYFQTEYLSLSGAELVF